MTVKVLSAHRSSDGLSVWLAADGHWDNCIRSAFLARHPEAVAALEAAGLQACCSDEVVNINLIDVDERGDELRPLLLRENNRYSGKKLHQAAQGHPLIHAV